jgi:hypothetical protein
LGTGTLQSLSREQLEWKEQEEREAKAEMSKFARRVRKIFIDSDHFYRLNQKFFILLLLFVLQ